MCEINYKIWAQPGTASGWGPPISIIGGVQHLMHIVGLDSDESEIGVGVSLEQHQADNQSIHSD